MKLRILENFFVLLSVASAVIGKSGHLKGQVHFLVFKFTLLFEQQIAISKFNILAVCKTFALKQKRGTFPSFTNRKTFETR